MAATSIRSSIWPASERGTFMSIRLGRSATQELTRISLVLSARRTGRGWLAGMAVLVGVLSIGAGSGYFFRHPEPQVVAQPAGVPQETQVLQQRLEQTRLTMSLSESRSHELERQIDALNQRLRESQEELTFFRQAREGKH